MILSRIGNKQSIAKEIQKFFPVHTNYAEPFFGAGGMFFNKPKAKNNIVNDLDSDVFNLFQVIMNQKEDFENAFYRMPVHSDLLKHWKQNKETDTIMKAVRFVLLSNFTYLGKQDTLLYKFRSDTKTQVLNRIDRTFKMLENVKFNNSDFRRFFNSISFVDKDYGKESFEREKTFFYNDSPYLGTTDTYSNSDTWTEQDASDLIDCNVNTGCKFAYSEFNHPFILQKAKEHNLNIITIGERRNLKNKRIEILLTNCEQPLLQTSLF